MWNYLLHVDNSEVRTVIFAESFTVKSEVLFTNWKSHHQERGSHLTRANLDIEWWVHIHTYVTHINVKVLTRSASCSMQCRVKRLVWRVSIYHLTSNHALSWSKYFRSHIPETRKILLQWVLFYVFTEVWEQILSLFFKETIYENCLFIQSIFVSQQILKEF